MIQPAFCDLRSWKNIQTLNQIAQEKALEWLEICRREDFPVVIICGTRTYTEQDELYAQGRSKSGNIVTNAKGGQSWHNFGIAWDFGVFEGVSALGGKGQYLGESEIYKKAGKIAEGIGLEWGGRWKFVDEPHIQLAVGLTLAQAREKFENGEILG